MKLRRNGATIGIPAGLGIGIMAALVITLMGAAFVAYLIASEKAGEGTIGYMSMVIMAAATATGSWIAASLVKRRRLQMCMMIGGCYYLLLLSMTAMFFGGKYEGMGIAALVIVATCAVVAFIPTSTSKISMKRKRAYR